jgi:tRNA (cmo5U34)-methyltransferase
MKDWTFKNFADDFDAHVREQLPWYDLVTDAVAFIAKNYISSNGTVYDIGCSTGNITKKLLPTVIERKAVIFGIDSEESMIKTYKESFKNKALPVFAKCANAQSYNFKGFDVAIVFLTAMFIPKEEQELFFYKLYENINEGGCIIVVDKVNESSGYIATVLKRLTMHFKMLNGADAIDIVDKELRLAGVQRPIDESSFSGKVTQFFQMGEFKGWVIENDSKR